MSRRKNSMRTRDRAPRPRASIGTALVLMATGGVLAFGVNAPAAIEKYVDLLDLGLILVWAGILLLVMQVVMTRPQAKRGRTSRRRAYDDRHWETHGGDVTDDSDVHRPGYAGETQRLPTVRKR